MFLRMKTTLKFDQLLLASSDSKWPNLYGFAENCLYPVLYWLLVAALLVKGFFQMAITFS